MPSHACTSLRLVARLAAALFFIVRADAATTITYTNNTDISTTYNTDDSGAPYTFTIASGLAFQRGVVTGSGGFTKTGAGTIELTGSGDNVGLTATVNAGTLNLAKASGPDVHAIGGGGTSLTINNGGTVRINGDGGDQIFDWASVAVNSGGVFDLVGHNEGFNGLTNDPLLGGGIVTNSISAVTSTLTLGTNGGDSTFGGVIQNGAGFMALTKVGAGTLTLTGSNTYTGATTVSAGGLALLGSGQLSDTTALTVSAGATFYLNGIIDTIGSLAGAGTVQLGNGILATGGGVTPFSGTISSGTLTKIGASALTLSGTADNSSLSAIVNDGTLVLGKTSSSTAHAVGLGLTITGGTAQLGGTGGDQLYKNVNVTMSGGTFDMNGLSESFNNLTGAAGTVKNTVANTTSTLTLGENNGAGADNNNAIFSGVIQDGETGGKVALVKIGTGTLTLLSAQTYTGATTISSGKLALLSSGGLPDSTALTVEAGATFDMSGVFDTVGSIAGGGAIILGGTLTAGGNNASTTFSGGISGGGGFTKTGTGALTLSGNNTYTGTTTISAGTLVLGHANGAGPSGFVTVAAGATFDTGAFGYSLNRLLGASEDAGTVTGSGTFSYDSSSNKILSAALAGSASLAKSNTGTLTLDGGVTYTGATTISAGTLQIGSGGGTGSLASSGVVNNAALVFNRTGTLAYAGVISGTGTLTKLGTGTLTLSGNNTYTGGTTISNGTLALGHASGAGASGTVTIATGATFDTGAFGFSLERLAGTGAVGGTGILTDGADNGSFTFTAGGSGGVSIAKTGTGTLTLTGANTYTGGTTISGGTLQIGNGGTTGSIAGNIADATALVFNRSDGLTYAGAISGVGTLTKLGAGTLTLSGGSTYTGGTTVSAGTLRIGSSGSVLSDSGPVTVNGGTLDVSSGGNETIGSLAGAGGAILFGNGNTLTVNQTVADAYAGAIGGTGGSLVKQGAATLTLTGNNTYIGATTVSAGTLALSGGGKLGTGTVFVRNNATLDLGGTTQTVAGVGAGGTGAVGTITAGTISTTGGIYLQDGTFAGTLTGSGSSVALLIGGNASATVALNGTNDMVNSNHLGVVIGTAGTGAAGTVKVGNANALAAATEKVHLESGTLDLNGVAGVRAASLELFGSGVALVNQNAASAASFAGGVSIGSPVLIGGDGDLSLGGVISGGGQTFTKTGAGTLTLSGNNTYSGGTTISAGTLLLGHANGAGATGTITVATGATFDTAGYGLDLSRLAGSGTATGSGAFSYNSTTDKTLAVALAGSASLAKFGTSALTLSGNGSYTGGTTISAGTLLLGHANGAGTAGAVTVSPGATFNTATFGFDLARLAGGGTATGSGVFSYNSASDKPLATVLAGSASLSKSGTSTLTLSGGNSYTGGTTISAGTLTLGNASGAGTAGAVTVASGATFNTATFGFDLARLAGSGAATGTGVFSYNSASDKPLATVLTGSGSLSKSGAGTLALSGNNTYTGATTISGGTLQILDGTTGSFASSGITDNASLVFNRSADLAYNGVIGGSGALAKLGAGKLTLTGANTYTGPTTISAGTLALGTVGATGPTGPDDPGPGSPGSSGQLSDTTALIVASGATFDLNGLSTGVGSLAGAGNVALGAGALTVGGSNTSTVFSGAISGSGSLAKTGSGTLTLSGASTYDGFTQVSAGTLQFVQAAARAPGSLTVESGAAAVFNVGGPGEFTSLDSVAAQTFAAGSSLGVDTTNAAGGAFTSSTAFTGAFSLVKLGPGTLTLTGSNTYTGATTISAGTLQFAATTALGPGALTAASGATAAFNVGGPDEFTSLASIVSATTFAAGSRLGVDTTNAADGAFGSSTALSGGFGLVKLGTGTLTLSGNSAFTGGTTLAAGTLGIGHNNALGTGTLTIAGGGIRASGAARTISNPVAINAGFTLGRLLSMNGPATLNADVTITSSNPDAAAPAQSTLGGDIAGPHSLTFAEGPNPIGTIVLLGVNTYSGGTTFAGGIVRPLNAGTLGTGPLTFTGGTLYTISSFTVPLDTAINSGGGTFQTDASLTLSGTLSGTGGLTKTGAGSLILTGTNTYTGAVTITQGTLQVGSGGATGSLAATAIADSGAVVFNRSDALTFAGAISGTGGLTKTGAGTLILTGTNTHTGGTTISAGALQIGNGGTAGSLAGNITDNGALVFNRSNSLTFTGTISGSGSLDKGSSSLVLTADNTYTGATTISTGTLQIGNGGAAGSLASASIVNNGTLAIARTGALAFPGAISGTGGLSIGSGSPAVTLTGNNTYTGATTLASGSLLIGTGGTTGSLASSGISFFGSSTITFNRSDDSVYAGVISGTGTGSVTKLGAGTLTLSGNSSWNGATIVSAGTLALTGANTLFGGITLSGGRVVVSSAANYGGAGNSFTFTGGTLQATAGFVVPNSATLGAGGGTIEIGSGQTLSWTGAITGGAGNPLTKTGAGTLALLGTGNTYAGDTIISAGTLQLGSAGTELGGAHAVAVNGGTFALGTANATIGTLSGTGGAVNLVNGGARTLTVNQSADGAFAGVIQGIAGRLVKQGAGTLTLTGTSTYTGATTISAGTLVVDGSIAGSSLTTVQSGAILGGRGTVGPVALGGTISPGNSPGTLNTGDETWNGGAGYVWEINKATGGAQGGNPGWDWLNVTGTLAIDSTAENPFVIRITSLTLGDVAGPAAGFTYGQAYHWIIATASGGIPDFTAGKFLIDTSAFFNDPANADGFTITNVGNDLVLNLVYVPEPAQWGAVLGAALLGMGFLRRRRGSKQA